METVTTETPKKRTRSPNKPKRPAATLPPADALDDFVARANAEPTQAIAMMFWLNRHRNREFTIRVKASDVKAFRDCTAYLKVQPQIKIVRPAGLPAQPAIPATTTRSGIAAREATPPKPYAIIQMLDEAGDSFVAIENNEEDFERAEHMKSIQALRDKAPRIAQQLIQNMQQGITSDADIQEAVNALNILANA